MKRITLFLALAVLAMSVTSVAHAVIIVPGPSPVAPFAGTVIDFEGMAEGTLIDTQYSGLGVTFSQELGGRPQIDNMPPIFFYGPGSGTGVLTGSTEGGYPFPTVAGLVGTFTSPVARAGAFFSDTAPLGDYVFSAFAPGGALLESYTLVLGDPRLPIGVGPGVLGSGLWIGFDFGSDVIGRVQFGPSSSSTDAFAIDDFRFARAEPAVPEPSTALFVGLGLVGLAVSARKVRS